MLTHGNAEGVTPAEVTGEMGAGRVIVTSPWTAPAWLHHKSLTLLAEEVIPHFRPTGDGRAVWQREPRPGFRTTTEFEGT